MRIKQRIECTCKNCKKVFFIGLNKFNAGKGKYCSKQCYTNYTNKNTVKNILNSSCKNCGQRYHIEPKQIKKYCSKKCAVISSRRRIKKKCFVCNKEFETKKHGNSKFCSRKCYIEQQLKQYKCENCGLDFTANRYDRNPNRKYHFCSNKCKFQWHKGKPHPAMSNWLAINILNEKFNFNGKQYKNGYYTSKLSGVTYWHQGSYELKRMEQLDEIGVKWIKNNKLKIKYIDKNGVNRYYIPDFIINDVVIEEVKPMRLLFRDNNPEKFMAGIDYCKINNLTYKVITEKDLNIL